MTVFVVTWNDKGLAIVMGVAANIDAAKQLADEWFTEAEVTPTVWEKRGREPESWCMQTDDACEVWIHPYEVMA